MWTTSHLPSPELMKAPLRWLRASRGPACGLSKPAMKTLVSMEKWSTASLEEIFRVSICYCFLQTVYYSHVEFLKSTFCPTDRWIHDLSCGRRASGEEGRGIGQRGHRFLQHHGHSTRSGKTAPQQFSEWCYSDSCVDVEQSKPTLLFGDFPSSSLITQLSVVPQSHLLLLLVTKRDGRMLWKPFVWWMWTSVALVHLCQQKVPHHLKPTSEKSWSEVIESELSVFSSWNLSLVIQVASSVFRLGNKKRELSSDSMTPQDLDDWESSLMSLEINVPFILFHMSQLCPESTIRSIAEFVSFTQFSRCGSTTWTTLRANTSNSTPPDHL